MKEYRPALNITAILIFAFLYLPLLSVAVFSVNSTKIGLMWGGFTWKWYIQLLSNKEIQSYAMNTFFLATVSTVISTFLGTILAVGLFRFPWSKKLKSVFETMLNLPVVTPDIIFAVALMFAFGSIRYFTGLFDLGMPTMIVGHVTFQIAFVALVIRGRLELIGHDLEEAAYDLYASHNRVLFKILIPLLKPGIIAGAMLAFTLSLDDFVISFFTAGPKSTTLPLYIFGSVKRGISPEIHALSTVIMIVTVVVVVLMQKITSKSGQKVH